MSGDAPGCNYFAQISGASGMVSEEGERVTLDSVTHGLGGL